MTSPQKRRPPKYRARRERRAQEGMMLLVDGSRHDWLEGRGPRLTLLGFADDATGKVPTALFQKGHEDAAGYLRLFRRQVETHGVPLSIYRDQHGTMQRNDRHWSLEEQLAGRQFPTQVGRALEELDIEAVVARSPQAKGRIERTWRTFQDRLISELRLLRGRVLSALCQGAHLSCFDRFFGESTELGPASARTGSGRPDTDCRSGRRADGFC